MHRIDEAGHAGNLFDLGNPGVTEATLLGKDWPNAVQEEIAKVIEDAGIVLAKGTNTQLAAALPKPKGFLENGGFLQTGDAGYSGAAGGLEIRPFVAEVAGRFVVNTAGTVIANALSDITADGWYGVTVDQAGVLAVEGSPATPLTGANTVRPTAGGGAGFGFDAFREADRGYYKDATHRYLMALWVDNASDTVLYAVELGHGNNETGDNARGDWRHSDGELEATTIETTALTTSATDANVFRSGIQAQTWPITFQAVPQLSPVFRGVSGKGVWFVFINVPTTTTVGWYLGGSAVTAQGHGRARGRGKASWL